MHAHSTIRYEDLRAILLDYYREHKPRSRNAIQAKRIATEISSLKKFLLAPTSWIGFSSGCRSPRLRRNLPFAGTYSCLCDRPIRPDCRLSSVIGSKERYEGPLAGYSLRVSPFPQIAWICSHRRALADARNWRDHCHLQRGLWRPPRSLSRTKLQST